MCYKYVKLTLLLTIYLCVRPHECTHLTGTFKPSDFFKFLIKFGFQQTDRHQPDATYGYIFGNITSRHKFPVNVTFAVLERSHFLDYYKNSLYYNKTAACKRMFSKLNSSAYHPICHDNGKDYLRRIPCPKGQLCDFEDNPWHVIKNHQFTFAIRNLKQPSYVDSFTHE